MRRESFVDSRGNPEISKEGRGAAGDGDSSGVHEGESGNGVLSEDSEGLKISENTQKKLENTVLKDVENVTETAENVAEAMEELDDDSSV